MKLLGKAMYTRTYLQYISELDLRFPLKQSMIVRLQLHQASHPNNTTATVIMIRIQHKGVIIPTS